MTLSGASPRAVLGADDFAPRKSAKNNSRPTAATNECGRSWYCIDKGVAAVLPAPRRGRNKPIRSLLPHVTFGTPDVSPRPKATRCHSFLSR
jgi:hypothetical protein